MCREKAETRLLDGELYNDSALVVIDMSNASIFGLDCRKVNVVKISIVCVLVSECFRDSKRCVLRTVQIFDLFDPWVSDIQIETHLPSLEFLD